MAQIECGRGHLYDPEKYPTCPYCKNNQQITVAAAGRTAPIRVTDTSRTAPLSGTPVTAAQKTAPLTPQPAPAAPGGAIPVTADSKTMPPRGYTPQAAIPVTAPQKTMPPQGLRPCRSRARRGAGAHRAAQVPRPQRAGRGQDRGHDAGADGL